jgi:hypothetical protein
MRAKRHLARIPKYPALAQRWARIMKNGPRSVAAFILATLASRRAELRFAAQQIAQSGLDAPL